jgi:hypothetical protein
VSGTLELMASEVGQILFMVGILSDQLTVEVVNARIVALFENLARYPGDFSAVLGRCDRSRLAELRWVRRRGGRMALA